MIEERRSAVSATAKLAVSSAAIPARKLPSDELEACRLDPGWEARQGIADYVYCRECGVGFQSAIQGGHLETKHQMSGEQYGLKYPGARRLAFGYAARQNDVDVQQSMEDFADLYETPDELEAYRNDPALEARRRIANYIVCRVCGRRLSGELSGKRAHLWRKHQLTERAYHDVYPAAPLATYARTVQKTGADVQELMAKDAARYVTSEELTECRNNPCWERQHNVVDFAVCRVCGRKLMSLLPRHLSTAHGQSATKYSQEYPRAPLSVPRDRQLAKEAQSRFVSKRQKLLAEAERILARLRSRQKPEHQQQAALIRSRVDASIPGFETLFSLAEIRRNSRLLFDNWTHPNFSQEQITAAKNAVIARATSKKRATIAARWLVAIQTDIDFDTVARYHRGK